MSLIPPNSSNSSKSPLPTPSTPSPPSPPPPSLVLPGQPIDPLALPSNSVLRLGPGLALHPTSPLLAALRPGIHAQLRTRGLQHHWIEGWSKRYVPALGDPVIGFVLAKLAHGYRVDIGAAHPAYLDGLAFESATKRARPNLRVGAVVYARVSLVPGFSDPEIECVDPSTQKSVGFGEMTAGMVIRNLPLERCRLSASSSETHSSALLLALSPLIISHSLPVWCAWLRLISPPHEILDSIGQRFKFEVSIGLNGRVWCKAQAISDTIEIVNRIKGSC